MIAARGGERGKEKEGGRFLRQDLGFTDLAGRQGPRRTKVARRAKGRSKQRALIKEKNAHQSLNSSRNRA